MDLYAGLPVTEVDRAAAWYERLLGEPATFVASPQESVWDLDEGRAVFVEHAPEHAGHARVMLFVDDLEARVAEVAARGLEPVSREEYENGVRKANYLDPDGNQVSLGGLSAVDAGGAE